MKNNIYSPMQSKWVKSGGISIGLTIFGFELGKRRCVAHVDAIFLDLQPCFGNWMDQNWRAVPRITFSFSWTYLICTLLFWWQTYTG